MLLKVDPGLHGNGGWKVFFQDRDVERIGDFAFVFVAMKNPDEFVADHHLHRCARLRRRHDDDAVVGEGVAEKSLHAGNLIKGNLLGHRSLQGLGRAIMSPWTD